MKFQPDIFSGKTPAISDTITRSVNSKIYPAVKEKRAEIPDIYNELTLRFGNNYQMHFRAYDDGIAYRWETGIAGEITVLEEEAVFNFQPGTIVYYPQVVKRSDADIFRGHIRICSLVKVHLVQNTIYGRPKPIRSTTS
jgi:alpha-glucosidase